MLVQFSPLPGNLVKSLLDHPEKKHHTFPQAGSSHPKTWGVFFFFVGKMGRFSQLWKKRAISVVARPDTRKKNTARNITIKIPSFKPSWIQWKLFMVFRFEKTSNLFWKIYPLQKSQWKTAMKMKRGLKYCGNILGMIGVSLSAPITKNTSPNLNFSFFWRPFSTWHLEMDGLQNFRSIKAGSSTCWHATAPPIS